MSPSSALSTPAPEYGHDAANKKRLFLICLLACTTTSMSFVLRSSIAQDIQTTMFDPIDPLHSAALIGSALGVAFLSFAVTVALGSPLIDALQRLSLRVDEPDIRFFVVVLTVQQEVGGNLAEVLSNLSGIIRKRKHLRMKVKAMTSEGRATTWVLAALPVFVTTAIYFTTPTHLTPFITSPTGNLLLAAAIGIVLFGLAIVRKMVNFKA